MVDSSGLTVSGGAGDDRINTGPLRDTLRGGKGSDDLSGGQGDDALDGGTGGDMLYGGAEADGLQGDDGADTVRYPGDQPVTVTLNDELYNDGTGDEGERFCASRM